MVPEQAAPDREPRLMGFSRVQLRCLVFFQVFLDFDFHSYQLFSPFEILFGILYSVLETADCFFKIPLSGQCVRNKTICPWYIGINADSLI